MNSNVLYGLSIGLSGRKSIGFLLVSLLFFSSCIRDNLEPCPPLQVELTVKDKNYFNVDNVPLETRKSESLAFREYVPTLYYALQNADTGEVVEEQGVFNVTSNEKTIPITFCECLPTGKYVLTVWGGFPDNTSLTDKSLTNIIHSNGNEGKDIYLVHDTLTYNAHSNHFVANMERVTGKLLIQVTNLPTDVLYVDKIVNQIFERVNYQFSYQNPITVHKDDEWNPSTEIVLSTILAPSTDLNASLLHLNFYKTPDRANPDLTPKDVYITMKRNQLTTLKYVYDDEANDFYIYLLVNDAWEVIYNLEIN